MSEDNSPFGGSETTVEGADFARELSLFDIIVIGIGAMIGGSIFVLTGLAAGESVSARSANRGANPIHPRGHQRVRGQLRCRTDQP